MCCECMCSFDKLLLISLIRPFWAPKDWLVSTLPLEGTTFSGPFMDPALVWLFSTIDFDNFLTHNELLIWSQTCTTALQVWR